MNWPGLFVGLFLAVGCLTAFEALLVTLVFKRLLSGIHPMAAIAASLDEGRRAEIGRARNLTRNLLQIFPQVVTWPIMYAAFGGKRRSFEKAVNLRLRWPLDVTAPVWLLAFSVLVAFLGELNEIDWYLQAACFAVIGASIAFPARWIIDGANLRVEMRRTLRNPIILFAIVAISTFMTLSIAASVLLEGAARSRFRWGSVWPEARQVWKLGHISAVWQARPTRVTEILVAVAALAVYALLVSQLSNPLRFRRTDEDRIEIALRLLVANRGDGSERWLKKVRTDNPKALSEYLRVQGMLAVKNGELPLALERARAVATLQRQRITPVPRENKDDGRMLLAKWAEFFIRLDGGETHSRVVGYLIADGIGDACLTSVVPALLFFELGEIGKSKLGARLAQAMEQTRSRAATVGQLSANLETLASVTARRANLPAGMTDPPYSLALATIEGLSGQLSDAATRLLGMRRTRRLPERIIKRVLSGRVVVQHVRQERGFGESREVARQDAIGLLGEARSWQLTEFPWWLREWLQEDIGQRLRQPIRRWAGKDIAAAMSVLRDFLAGRCDAAEFELNSSGWSGFIKPDGTLEIARGLKAVSSGSPGEPDKAVIFDGPIERNAPGPYRVFRYCVRFGSRGRHRDIYVYIDKNAPASIMRSTGRGVLEEVLNRGDAPPRIIIDSHGEIISKR